MLEPRADSQGTPSDGSHLASPKRTPSPRDRPDAPRERKNGLSCAECRRSKLRCDRNVPCQACVRRGCAKLCPNGTMAATKGNKALQSHAQKLGQQVTSMAAKIKELEEALAVAQIRGSSDPPEETQAAHKGFVGSRRRSYGVGTGSLALDDEGRSRYFGDTAASEFLSGLMPQGGLHNMCYTPNFDALSLPPEIVMLYNAFPFGLRHRPYDSTLFLPYMPPRNKALDIANIYFERFACLNNPITYDDFTETLIEPIYGSTNMPRLETLHPHRLSLFLGIMAIGCARSSTTEATRNTSAERYLVLACAALSLAPIIAEAMTATVQALYMINGYISTSTRLASEESWTLIGIMARIGDRIALHRDGAQFNLSPSELKRRRLIFWELYKTDAWTSFITGRSPAINLAHVDTKFPDSDADPQLMQYPAWKFRYAAACLWPTLKIATADVASYEDTIALDRKIRMFPVPTHLQATLQDSEAWSWSNDPSEALQQFSVICDRELNLLFLHRNYVAVALQDKDPLTHKFGGSVLAAYRGATRMCFALRDLYRLHAPSIGQLWYFWSGLFSSCIVLGAIPIMAPGCSLAQNALANFKIGCRLYSDSSMLCKDPSMMDSLNKLEHRAETNFVSYWANPANYKSTGPLPGEIDELCLLGGTEKLIKPRSPSNLSTPHTRTSAQLSHMRTQHEQIQERASLHQPQPHSHIHEFNAHSQLEAPPHQQPLFSPVYPGHPIVSELDFSISDMPRDPLASFDPILNAPDPHTYAYSQPQHSMDLSYPNVTGWEDQGNHPHPAGDYLMSRENIWGSFIGDLMNAPAPTAYTPYGP